MGKVNRTKLIREAILANPELSNQQIAEDVTKKLKEFGNLPIVDPLYAGMVRESERRKKDKGLSSSTNNKLFLLQCHYDDGESPQVDNFVGVFTDAELAKDGAAKSKYYFNLMPLEWEQDGNEFVSNYHIKDSWFSIKEIELNKVIT